MNRVFFKVMAVLVLCSLPSLTMAGTVPLINDNFDSYPIGHSFVNQNTTIGYVGPIIPANWYLVSGPATSGFSTTIVDSSSIIPGGTEPIDPSGTAGKVVEFYDDRTTNPAKFLYHTCKKLLWWYFTAEMDIMLPQNTHGFRIYVNWIQGRYPVGTANGGAQAQNGNSWAAAILFEGNTPYAPFTEGSPGRICYQTESFTQKWEDTGVTYTPGQWYTVRFELDLTTNPKTYKIKFGPRGAVANSKDLPEITPPGGVSFIKKMNVGGATVGAVNAVSIASSEKLASAGETPGRIYIDRVFVTGDQPINPDPDNPGAERPPVNMAELRRLKHQVMNDPPEPGDYVQTFALGGSWQDHFRIASVGTDQLGKYFYLTSGSRATGKADPHGIRVRLLPSIIYDGDNRGEKVIRTGDVVDITGYIQIADENGAMVTTGGEREIYCTQIETYSPAHFGQPFVLPEPIAIANKNVGGSDFFTPGSSSVCLPGVFGKINPDGGYFQEPGLNNVGTYGKFWGRVTYVSTPADKYHPFFYIDDGSKVDDGSGSGQTGVRVLMRSDRFVDPAKALANLPGKYVMVPGIVGAMTKGELTGVVDATSSTNVRVIRAFEELFFDMDDNGLFNEGDMMVDLNQNNIYDGIIVLDTP